MAETVLKPPTEVAVNQERVDPSDRPENTFKENEVYSNELTKDLDSFFNENGVPLAERCRVNVLISKNFKDEVDRAKAEIVQSRNPSEATSVQLEPTFVEILTHVNENRARLNKKVIEENARIVSEQIDKPPEKKAPPSRWHALQRWTRSRHKRWPKSVFRTGVQSICSVYRYSRWYGC